MAISNISSEKKGGAGDMRVCGEDGFSGASVRAAAELAATVFGVRSGVDRVEGGAEHDVATSASRVVPRRASE